MCDRKKFGPFAIVLSMVLLTSCALEVNLEPEDMNSPIDYIEISDTTNTCSQTTIATTRTQLFFATTTTTEVSTIRSLASNDFSLSTTPTNTELEEEITSVTSSISESVASETVFTDTSSTTFVEVTSPPIETSQTVSDYIPDSNYYLGIANEIAAEYGCEVVNAENYMSYQNPIQLDPGLTESIFRDYVETTMTFLIDRGNGNRHTFNVWVADERSSGNQTKGPGFYLYIG